MLTAHRVARAMLPSPVARLPVVDTPLRWDGVSQAYRDVRPPAFRELAQPLALQVQGPRRTASQAPRYWTTAEIGLAPTIPWHAVAWEQEAARMTFALTPVLLADTVRGVIPSMAGVLRWAPVPGQAASPTPFVHAVLFGHDPGAVLQRERVTILPTLPVHDPLQHHMVLTLQTALTARSRVEHLYAETLVEALLSHFLRRYADAQPSLYEATGGITAYRLQRVLTYIHDHLAQELSLTTLAGVAQMSLTHFAHLFKHALGLPPHQYVVRCRMQHAMRLLVETTLPLCEIGARVGYADQSHFTALFRKHVSLPPLAYRHAAQQAFV